MQSCGPETLVHKQQPPPPPPPRFQFFFAECFTIIIPERSATAEATPIRWASNSVAAEEVEFISRGVGTSCSTTEPVIKLTTAKVPEGTSSRTADALTERKKKIKRLCSFSNYRQCQDNVKLFFFLARLSPTKVKGRAFTCGHMAPRAKKHVEEDRKERGVEAKYWCHGCKQSKGHAWSEVNKTHRWFNCVQAVGSVEIVTQRFQAIHNKNKNNNNNSNNKNQRKKEEEDEDNKNKN